MLGTMKPGAVLVDVAIDQGGCFETSHPTTHSDPIFEVDGIVHYCVANMPGAVPVTSTKALTNVTLPYAEALADFGLRDAIARDPALARGVNVMDGKVTYEAVAEAHGLEYSPLSALLPLERRLDSCGLLGEPSLARPADGLCSSCGAVGWLVGLAFREGLHRRPRDRHREGDHDDDPHDYPEHAKDDVHPALE